MLNTIIDDLDSLFFPYTIDLSIFANISDADIIDHIQRVCVTFYKQKSEQTTERLGFMAGEITVPEDFDQMDSVDICH